MMKIYSPWAVILHRRLCWSRINRFIEIVLKIWAGEGKWWEAEHRIHFKARSVETFYLSLWKKPPSYPSTQLIQPLQSACEDTSFEPAVGLGNPLYEFSALSLLFSNEKEVYKTWASLLGKSAPSYLRADGLLLFLSVNLLGLILFHSYLPEE